jgi:ribosome-interacting GTPase 1
VLREYKVHNADVLLKQDVTIDEFIDVVEGNRKYMPALYVMNKIDQVSAICIYTYIYIYIYIYISYTYKCVSYHEHCVNIADTSQL